MMLGTKSLLGSARAVYMSPLAAIFVRRFSDAVWIRPCRIKAVLGGVGGFLLPAAIPENWRSATPGSFTLKRCSPHRSLLASKLPSPKRARQRFGPTVHLPR
ncbi:hypothetical protein KCP75_13815 [Salmonella enterica subsp. enterica]|nr:hypothetical protein KCP75_13815 [Salmonella enterica subsp. enterica]